MFIESKETKKRGKIERTEAARARRNKHNKTTSTHAKAKVPAGRRPYAECRWQPSPSPVASSPHSRGTRSSTIPQGLDPDPRQSRESRSSDCFLHMC